MTEAELLKEEIKAEIKGDIAEAMRKSVSNVVATLKQRAKDHEIGNESFSAVDFIVTMTDLSFYVQE
jgi:hypothetical protein